MSKVQKTGSTATKKIKKNDMVDVVGTGSGKYLQKGKSYRVAYYVADKLVKNGSATLKK